MPVIFFNFQDLVAMPDFDWSAMENWGLMTFRREYLVYDENFVDAFTKEHMMSIITHELAHLVRYEGCYSSKSIIYELSWTNSTRC